MIAGFALTVVVMGLQLATLAFLAPFLTDLEAMVDAFCSGRAGPLPGWRWRQIRMGWHQRANIPPLSWMSLCATILPAFGIPLASTLSLFRFLSEPLACGVCLIFSCALVWAQALNDAPTRLLQLHLTDSLSHVGRDLLFLVPLLALTGTLITVGLPGAGALSDLLQQRLLQPAPALLGGLVFIAVALLLILNRRFLCQSWQERLIAGATGRHRSLLRFRHDFSAICWYLLVADLIWPDSVATASASIRHLLVLWCLAAPLKLACLVAVVTGWRGIRPLPSARLALVLSGAAILLVLAGRLAT
ncbi:hypothetical protein [Asaia krungthepensis]|uniref:Uncharacterized protein n=1 Tax=Asaia krungthepensis NRIC 0535 TaxID=1307925 RepID=A0ABQ0Q294_9PROT|nr:hypothetical protein [Asaia krungthepensis]GBQ87943.1 hypothetical protein AA0535_1409 [Asaia krungthepensis NRIC 0535]